MFLVAMTLEISLDELMQQLKTNVRPKHLVGEGLRSRVYGIKKSYACRRSTYQYAVKAYLGECYTGAKAKDAAWEFSVAQELYSAGVHVPKPIGIIFLRGTDIPQFLRAYTEDVSWFFVMEYIKTTPYHNWTTKEKELVQDMYKQQKEKVCKIGYEMHDSSWSCNVLFDRKQKKLYLNDFVHWRKICA